MEPVLLDAAAVRKLARDAGLDVIVAREDDAIVVSTRTGAPLLDVEITGPGAVGLDAGAGVVVGDGFSNRQGALVVADPDADPDEDATRVVAVLDDETWAAATLPAQAALKALGAGALPAGAEVERAPSAFARTLKRGPR